MRIQTTDRRERLWDALQEATGESTTSGALDAAATYYLRMHGDNHVAPHGRITALMERAIEQGSLTPAEIADVLDVDELPVEWSAEWDYGQK